MAAANGISLTDPSYTSRPPQTPLQMAWQRFRRHKMAMLGAVMLLAGKPNDRLVSFGRSLGRYLQQIVEFLTFATEEMPFPFNDWPAGG